MVGRYDARQVSSAEVIRQLVELAKEVLAAQRRNQELGLSDDEVAFHDAIVGDPDETMESDPVLAEIARDLVREIRADLEVDWTSREALQADIGGRSSDCCASTGTSRRHPGPATVVAHSRSTRSLCGSSRRRVCSTPPGRTPEECSPARFSRGMLLSVIHAGPVPAARRTVLIMSPPESATRPATPLLSEVAALSDVHRATLSAELELRDARDDAIVRAVRAGARLEEIADVSAISRAAVSKIARRVLPSRTGRGGPYSRRRGSAAALEGVAEATRALTLGREHSHDAKHRRDDVIARAIAEGIPLTRAARAAGMSQASVSTIAHATVLSQAKITRRGAVASR